MITTFVRRALIGLALAVAGLGLQAGLASAHAETPDISNATWGVAHTGGDQGASDPHDVTPVPGSGLITAYSVHGSW